MKKRLYDAFQLLQEIAETYSETSEEFRTMSADRLKSVIDESAALADNYDGLYDMAVNSYGALYGIPEEAGSSYVSQEQLETAQLWTEDASLLNILSTPPGKGLTGLFSKKAKPEEYELFCQSARLLGRYYAGRRDQAEGFRNAFFKYLLEAMDAFRAESEAALRNAAPEEDKWTTFPISHRIRSDDVFIGSIEAPLASAAGMQDLCAAGLTAEHGADTWLTAPFAYEGKRPFSLFLDYCGKAAEGIPLISAILRNCIYQILRGMPAFSYQIVYLDPARGGKALGELQAGLYSAVDGNAFRLEESLYHNRFRLLTVADTVDAVSEELKQLDARIGAINRLCGGRSVVEYNAERFTEDGAIADDRDGVIPQTFLFFENTHGRLNDQTTQILEKLMENAEECGITLIVTSIHESPEPDEFERRLLAKGMDRLTMDQKGAGLSTRRLPGASLDAMAKFFNFRPYVTPMRHDAFLGRISDYFHPNLEVETRLEQRVDIDAEWGKYRADEGIEIPIGINSRNQITSVTIGNSENAHALLAGMTGCGKTSFMHTIINGVIMRYHPEDVQLWLSDYKLVEFQRYMENTPAHVKYVGAADSMEYTLSFMDRIYGEYERRLRLLGTLPSLTEYRKQYGPDSLPRLFIIVDEFHVMSNHCKDNPEYKTKLEHLLKAARGVGMTFLFADQNCAEGLGGLTEPGKQQLSCRMSMRQERMEEYNAAFNITNAKDVVPMQAVYEIVIKRFRKHRDAWGVEETVAYYDHNKTIFTSPEMRDRIAEKSAEAYGVCSDAVFVLEARRELPSWPSLQEASQLVRSGQTPVWLGIPVQGGKKLSFLLKSNFDENVMTVIPNDGMQADFLVNAVTSLRLREPCQVYLLAPEFDSLLERLQPWLERMKSDPTLHVVTDDEEICRTILTLRAEMEQRRKQREFSRICVFWLGMTEITQNLSYYPAKQSETYPSTSHAGGRRKVEADDPNSIMAVLEKSMEFFGESAAPIPEPETTAPGEETESLIYNASEDIGDLVAEGPKRGIHSFVLYSSYSAIKRVRCVKPDNFKYRIANQLSMDDASDFLGGTRNNKTLEGNALAENVAVFYDRINATQFMPFLSSLELTEQEGSDGR